MQTKYIKKSWANVAKLIKCEIYFFIGEVFEDLCNLNGNIELKLGDRFFNNRISTMLGDFLYKGYNHFMGKSTDLNAEIRHWINNN